MLSDPPPAVVVKVILKIQEVLYKDVGPQGWQYQELAPDKQGVMIGTGEIY